MAAPLALVWDLIAKDNASDAFKKIGEAAETTGKKTSKISETVKKVGEATAGAIAVVAVVATKMAVEMQAADAKIQGNAQITAKAATGIGDAFLKTAGTSTFSGKQMADAFAPVSGIVQTLSGHTLTAAASLKVMRVATDLAEASGTPLASTTADLVAVMQTYHLKLAGAADASNILFNTSRLTGVGLDTLTTTVDKLHAKLGVASPSLAQTSGLLVDLAQHGVSGSRGVLTLSTGMATLLGGSKATTNTLHDLGVKVYDASGKFVGMHSVLSQLTPKLAGMSDKQRQAAESALFGKTAAVALNTTILAGAKGFDTATAAVTKHEAVESAAKAASKTLEGQMKTLRASFSDIATLIGEKVIPIVQKVITWFEKHKTVALVLAGIIGGVLVAATAAWAVSLFTAGGALAFLMSPITLVVAAVALLAAGVVYAWNHFKTFRTVVLDVWHAIQAAAKVAVGFIGAYLHDLLAVWRAVWGAVKAVWTNVVKPVWDLLASHWKLVVQLVLGPLGVILVHWRTVWGAVQDVYHGVILPVFNAIVSTFHGAYTSIVSIIGSIGTVVARIGGFFSAAYTNVKTWIGKIVGFVGGLPGKITAFGGAMLSAGGHILGMMWNGIKSVWNNVVGWFKALPGKILSVLGIHSPPDWAVDAGGHIMKGILKGIINHAGGALGFMSRWGKQAAKKVGEAVSIGGNISEIKFGGLIGAVMSAMKLTGVGMDWLQPIIRRIMFESGGNPNAINLTDINAQHGHPSQGLMQTIDSTFRQFAVAGHDKNILDPVSNIAAAIRYIEATYGTIHAIDPPVQGYAGGAWNIDRDQFAYLHRREMVVPALAAEKFRKSSGFGGAGDINLTVNPQPYQSEHEIGTIAAAQIVWALRR